MKAIRLIEIGRPLEKQEIATPEVGSRDVLVRVKAAGICHSDVHFRSGGLSADPLPITLGHEVSGIVEQVGSEVNNIGIDDRVCLHYMVTCGNCFYCIRGSEQFCMSGEMIGKDRDGGYAEYISVPARGVFLLPPEIPFEQGAIMMCSSVTSLHALNKGRVKTGEIVAIWGVGGLGISAVQLARIFGAMDVYAVDIEPKKLELASRYGAIPINARESDPVAEILQRTNGRGVDVALELIGLERTMEQAVKSLAIAGRAVIAGLGARNFSIDPYHDLLGKESEIIGVSDHLAQEIPQLIEWVRKGDIVLDDAITQAVPLDTNAVNKVLDSLDGFGEDVRAVIIP
jgi:propanol-preferring alcohol dehydrogenase